MKKQLLAIAIFSVYSGSASAQLSNGLIAHWKMSGNGQDASGNGHTGTLRSVTPATGRDGNPGTALRFNDTMTYISVPYKADLNVSTFSICATLMVEGFNKSDCQSNYLLARDAQFAPASYSLNFFDNPYNDCLTLDTTKEVFAAEAGSRTGSHANWQYSPNIVRNQWYRVVGTFDGSTFRIYVNDSLMATNAVAGALPLTTSGAGILIGRLDTSGGYQYPFTGVIDDIRLYNRVLSQSEVTLYGASTLGVGPAAAALDLSLSPNPAGNTVTIGGDVAGAGYRIYNALGQPAASGSFAGGREIRIGNLPAGIYHIRITRGRESAMLRFNKL